MPDAAATDTKGASAGEDKNPPDLVGEELADSAKIWRVYERVAKEDDERRTKEWDSGLNNLALFAGLFSAVTTAFIIEARQDMEPDYAQLTFLVLNATAFGEKPVHQPFVIPSSARTVNCLWVASLILSLSAALIAIMGKDWIGMYTARPVCNLRQWAEMRSYRLLCVEQWYMSGVIAAAPVLLHVSLVLFGAGLVLFISTDPFTHRLTLGLSLAAGALYLVTTLSAIVFSASPFKSPATQMIRAAFSAFYSYVLTVTMQPKRDLVGTLLRDVNLMVVGRADESAFVQASVADAHLQPALSGRAALLSHQRHSIYPPGRNVVSSLPREANTMVVGRLDGFALLPSYAPYNRRRPNVPSMAAVLTGFQRTLVASVQSLRSLPSSLHPVYRSLKWSQVRLQLHSLVSSVRRIPFSDWFLSSLWTDLLSDRRPKLLADALSWLNAASQAPDVFQALVFALGDLDVGPQVAKHTSPALRTRLRAEIRRTWQQVDFLMLSRYVLADRNALGDPVLANFQFEGRFDLTKDSTLRCEDGIAAFLMILPEFPDPDILVQYFPNRVAQPRMHEFLLPYVQKIQWYPTEVLILLSNRYRTHLQNTNSFNLGNLEAHLYDTLNSRQRDAYATALTVKYGGTAGAIELLTFLCCNGVISDDTKPAAVELVLELLERSDSDREHRCLAYLFGSGELWDALWKDNPWLYDSLGRLSLHLGASCFHPFEPSSVRTLLEDRQFDLALARIVVMFFSPHNNTFGWNLMPWIKFLVGHLCQSPSSSLSDNDKGPDVIRLMLENAALLAIMDEVDYYAASDDVTRWGTAILTAIISSLGLRLRDGTTARDGERLVAALARTEVKGLDGPTRTWDLGEWLRTRALKLLTSSSSSTAMQDVHDTLSALYPLCEHNSELRVHWDRIGYPGRPGDIFSSPFLDIGAFFAIIEDPPWRRVTDGWYSSDDFLDDSSDDSSNDTPDDEE